MKSVQRRFNNISQKQPYSSSYMNFVSAIREQGFSKSMIRRWFNILVEKDEYDQSDKRSLLQQLYAHTEPRLGQPQLVQKMPAEPAKVSSPYSALSKPITATTYEK